MCQASKVADDWVVKGCHIHIGSVELRVFPNHLAGVGFAPFFRVTAKNRNDVAAAVKTATEKCLNNPDIRQHWIDALTRATRAMMSFRGQPRSLANGRVIEFKFLRIALERYGE